MAITLDPVARQQALASIKRYVLEELEQDVGDLKAGSVLDFFLRELAPTVYNHAIGDVKYSLHQWGSACISCVLSIACKVHEEEWHWLSRIAWDLALR